jgi:hypothetical protein
VANARLDPINTIDLVNNSADGFGELDHDPFDLSFLLLVSDNTVIEALNNESVPRYLGADFLLGQPRKRKAGKTYIFLSPNQR